MYDIRQFKPTLYLVVICALTGFAIAAEEPALWFLAIGAVSINAWLVRTGRFTPMPRWLSNGITLLAGAFVLMQAIGAADTPILLIGQGLVLLHLVKLFEQRANRDYAQLLVLSLLLMVAAAISTASFAFGMLFIAFLFISLYCCLLFHLKNEADKAKAAQPIAPQRFNAATLRQDQRYLPRSMRRLTGLISAVAMAAAVLVFLFFPRGTGAGMLGQLQMHPPATMSGFNDQVQFNEVAKITQNDTPVGTVAVWHNERPVTTGSLRLRGATFDRYFHGENGEWAWARGTKNNAFSGPIARDTQGGRTYVTPTFEQRVALPGAWRQAIHLDPIGSNALFALGGIRTFGPARDMKVTYARADDTLQHKDTNLNVPIEYEVTSTGAAPPPAPPPPEVEQSDPISPELAAFAKLAGGPAAAAARPRNAPAGQPAATDEQVARNIEQYLLTHFSYTLDLTESANLFDGRDPLVVFVTQTHRGHCEFFAGAMTVACQSLGMRARMVAGFVTDEYNSLGGFFQVRQSHAHTWVEVLTPDHGWVTFDPTSGRQLPPNESRSAWQHVKHVFDWMESKWAGSVIAYDTDRRENIIQKLNDSLLAGTNRGDERLMRLRRQVQALNLWWESLGFVEQANLLSVWVRTLAWVVTVMALVIIGTIVWFLADRHRIRRRARRIGLASLPEAEQLRMARQLGFYEEMTELLERHRITRPAHLTPREFSRSLTFLPTEAYDLIDGLTRIFYRVRYGGANVPLDQQRRLDAAVEQLGSALGPSKR